MTDELFKKRFLVTSPKHRDALMIAGGMRIALEALKDSGSILPGMKMAIAIVESVLAKEQIGIAGYAYREAAKAGADLSAVAAIYTQHNDDGELEMLVESEGVA